MKSYQFAGRPIYAGDASRLEEILKQADENLAGTVIDLRTFLEVGEASSPKPPDGWSYRRLPLTGAIISEQDLDVFRRELVRKPQTVVVGPNSSRPDLLLSASLARFERGGWDMKSRKATAEESERDLLGWLTRYLVRHGVEKQESLALLPTETSLRTKSKPRGKTASPAVEPTVEMEAISGAETSLEIEPTVELSLAEAAGTATSEVGPPASTGGASNKAGAPASGKAKTRGGKKRAKKSP